MMKRISRDPAEQTPFERFYLEWPKLLEDAGGVLYGANGLSEIGWEHRAAFLLFEAMGSPDWRDRPPPPEPHGGAWIGVADAESRTMAQVTAKGSKGGKKVAPATDPADLFSGLPETGQTCSECGLFQRQSPGGEVCANGHGGVQGEEPQTHYWYHPESDSLFTTAPGEAFPGDPLVEHIDADVYADLKAKQDADDPFACLDAPAEQEQDDDPFAIL